MGVRMGHASISENGTISGSKGDSTGKEVCVRSWYSKPWDYMAIHPDAAVREKHAKAVEAACANNNIGYSQNSRNTLNDLAKGVGYDLSKVGKCNCDCSSLQHVAAIASGVNIPYGSNAFRTGNMKAKLQAAGYKIITASGYLKSADYCVRGAIYVKANGHTVCGLDNGSKARLTISKANIDGNATSSTENTAYSGKGIGVAAAKGSMHVRTGAGTSYTSIGTISKGQSVEVLEVLSSGWYKIVWPSASVGYAYTSNSTGKYYTYTPKQTGSTSGAAQAEAAKSLDAALAGTYMTTGNLNMRTGAGKDKKILLTIPRGKSVQNHGYFSTAADGVKWLYVEYNGTAGFCSTKYLKKK